MEKHYQYLIIFVLFILCSCQRTGEIKIQNNIHNTRMSEISFGEYHLYDVLLPGETSDYFAIRDFKSHWPKKNKLEFYLEANNRRVYLKTKQEYILDYDDKLYIVIWDTTEVYNPLSD